MSEASRAYPEALARTLRLVRDIGVGAGDVGLSIGSGLVAEPVAGLAGLGELVRGRGLDRAGEAIEGVRGAMTYQPRSDIGRRGLQNIGEAIEPVATTLRENIADPVGEFSPALGAALIAVPEVIGPKGRPKVRAGKMGEILAEGKAPGIPVSSETGPILPRSADPRIPAEQKVIPRLTPMGKDPAYNERSAALLRSGKAERAIDELIGKGRAINPDLENWYGSEALRQFALNEGLSPQEFERMLAHFSSASQRNPVLQENLMGSHMWGLDRQGMLTPDKQLWTNKLARETGVARDDPGVIALPEGMGSLAQSHIFDRAQRLAAGADPESLFGDKLFSYFQNKLGNEMPVTIDVNAVKGPVMSARNPAWLKTLYTLKDPQGNVVSQRKPMQEYERGKLTPREAAKTPGLWVDAPASPGEYKAFEELWRRGAGRAGVRPAGAQALGWYGSSDVTALKTKPKTYVELIEQSARAAAARQGITPIEAMRRAVRGERGGQLGFTDPRVAALLAGGGGAAIAAQAAMEK